MKNPKLISAGAEPARSSVELTIAIVSVIGILAYLAMRYIWHQTDAVSAAPLYVVLIVGGIPLIAKLARNVWRRDFGSDLLAGVSIVTAALLQEYIVGCIVILMLSGGQALEQFATRRASAILDALVRRMPTVAHVKRGTEVIDVALDAIEVGASLLVFPHELCPVDGIVTAGHGWMDESYLTGEPYRISKAVGSQVLSGAINGENALTIEATALAVDSRYARIMRVMQEAETRRPRMRRLGDQLGAWYTPAALVIAALGWLLTGSAQRFLAVIVIATPCPLLLAIPIAIIGGISLAARRAIIIKDPSVLERIDSCRSIILDKTGTLTYGQPTLTEVDCASGYSPKQVLRYAASLEQYSKHPLAGALLAAARAEGLTLVPATQVSESPGKGLRGIIEGDRVELVGRETFRREHGVAASLPATPSGLGSILAVDGSPAATLRFQDEPRAESKPFIEHLPTRHGIHRVMILSGDRESEVRYLARRVGIADMYYGKTPEEKLAIVERETARTPTIFVGDGINDAPAMQVATVGLAFGHGSEITSASADAVVMEPSLGKIDELMHIGRRMRIIALQSAVGGMLLSFVGMGMALAGYLPPIAGAVAQEVIDVAAILNALRVALGAKDLRDFA